MYQHSDNEIRGENVCELCHAIQYVMLEDVKLFLA
jgi:hypothetical protein